MNDRIIKPRVRLVIINSDKILLSYVRDEKLYFYIGGKLEYGETVLQGCQREIKEECGDGVNFTFKKILYIRDYIVPKENEHSLEIFILGSINKFREIEGVKDKEFGGNHWQTWVDMGKLTETNVKPKDLTNRLISDWQNNFSGNAEYLGEIE